MRVDVVLGKKKIIIEKEDIDENGALTKTALDQLEYYQQSWAETEDSSNVLSVEAECHDLRTLPEDFHIQGNLNLSKTKIRKLPNGLDVTGDLDLSETRVAFLPEKLKVGGSLKLNSVYSLRLLPAGLEVGGDLDLTKSGIVCLPARLKVGGDLKLEQLGIMELPADLEVRGTIDLYKARNLISLPANLWSTPIF